MIVNGLPRPKRYECTPFNIRSLTVVGLNLGRGHVRKPSSAYGRSGSSFSKHR